MTISPLDGIPATVTPAGKLVIEPADRARLSGVLSGLRGKRVDVTVTERADTRSARANAYWHAVVCKIGAECVGGITPIEFHELMKQKFLTRARFDLVNPSTGEIEELQLVGSTSKLTISEFYDFVEMVRAWMGEFFGVSVPDPDPAWWRRKEQAA